MKENTKRALSLVLVVAILLSSTFAIMVNASEVTYQDYLAFENNLESAETEAEALFRLVAGLTVLFVKAAVAEVAPTDSVWAEKTDEIAWQVLYNTTAIEDYLAASGNQVVQGNFCDDVTLLGTTVQLGTSLAGLDLPADIRDLVADVTQWEGTPEDWKNITIDVIAVLPVVGALKNVDKVGDLLKASDEVGDLLKASDEVTYLVRCEDQVMALAGTGEIVHMGDGGIQLFKSVGMAAETAGDAGKGVSKLDDAKDASKLQEAARGIMKATTRSSPEAKALLDAFYNEDATKLMEKAGETVDNKCFSSFGKLKTYMNNLQGKVGETAWHHFIEQCQAQEKRSGFSDEVINQVLNIIRIPHGSGSLHSKVTRIYKMSQGKLTNYMPLRDYVVEIGMTVEEQWELGFYVIYEVIDEDHVLEVAKDGFWYLPKVD